MPFREEMNWDASKRRWHRYYRGTMYRVVASQLNLKDPTRDGTRKAANEWWQNKQRELDGPPPPDPIQQVYEEVVQVIAADPIHQERVEAIISLIPDKRAETPDRSIKANGEAFLELVRGNMRPRSFQELSDCSKRGGFGRMIHEPETLPQRPDR